MIASNGVSRIVVSGGLIAMLVFCSYAAVHRGLAALYAWPGQSTLGRWQDGKRHLRQQDWDRVQNSLERALQYDGRNPDLLHDLGVVYDNEVAYYVPGAASAEKNRTMARQYYLAALAARPTWPHDWIVLALVQYRLGRIDAGFYQALRRAAVLGPWEPSMKLMIADIGLHHWDKFDDAMRNLVTGIIRDGVNRRNTAMDMLKLLRRYNRLDMACNDNVVDETVGQYCKQYQRR